VLRLEDVTLAVGPRDLLVGASLHVHPHDKVGIVGPNGCGKTSMLRLLVGELEAESGRVYRRGGIGVGYLPQHAVSGSSRSVWDEAASGMTRIRALQADLERARRAVEGGDDAAIDALGEAEEAFRLAGGYAQDERVGEVLHGLGFGPDRWHDACDTFSGGWQMRIALARLLLSDPDVLLLDEPTNHLDIRSRSWLAKYLASSSATVVLVSHDRHLLDTVTNHTVEVRHKQLESYRGNLTAWLAEREAREALLASTARKQADEIAKLERFVERFGAKATKAAAARSKQKALDRIDRIELPQRDQRARLRLAEAPGCSKESLVLHQASTGWDDGPDIIRGVDLRIERGERWAVLGPNGAGKSTLMHLLSGRLQPRSGRRRVGKDVRIGVFQQDLAASLPEDVTALEAVLSAAPSALPERARAALGALGLRGDMALRPIGSLSGGERARVVLASFALQPYNVLLLDEPTNHLDVVTVDVLIEALAEWEGAILLVTHDRYLVEKLATDVAVVAEGAVETHEGVRPSDLEAVPVEVDKREVVESQGALDHAARKEARRERTKMQRRFDRLSKEMERLESELARIDEALLTVATDFQKAAELGSERDGVEAKLEAVFEELGELEEALGA
jgi:ATP-binding cassette subfamily F protein 3